MAALGKPAAGPAASPSPSPAPPSPAPAAGITPDVTSRLAALKERIAAQQAKIGGLPTPPTPTPTSVNPYLGTPARASPAPVDAPPAKPGLGTVAPHPLLADLTTSTSTTTTGTSKGRAGTQGRSKYAPMLPKFSSVKANARLAGSAGAAPAVDPRAGMGIPRAAPSLNPYTSASGPASGTSTPVSTPAPDLPSALSARRARPTLKFNARGKYIQRAEEMRHEAKMEALRQRIAENARKAGLDSEFEVSARSVKRQMPPEVEWWDAPLLRNRRYEDLDAGVKEGTTIYDEGNEYVTLFVQHPIPIPAPFEAKASEPRGLMLTKKVSSPSGRGERRADTPP